MAADENTVYVGKKGVMSYVLAVVTQFNRGTNQVQIKARGRAISRAVDVAEIVRNRFVTEAQVKDIAISTEELNDQKEKEPTKVSAIEITLAK
ncbi:DNA-binding protein Alba [archaeon]|nr:DNA-binding protein Alba [archaeon]